MQNKILMGLIFWTSWRVAQQKIKIPIVGTVFRKLTPNLTIIPIVGTIFCFLTINFGWAGRCSFWVNCKILRFLICGWEKRGGEDGGGRNVGPAFSARRPLTVWSWSEGSEWVKWRGVNPKGSSKFDETYIYCRLGIYLNRYTSPSCKTKSLWV